MFNYIKDFPGGSVVKNPPCLGNSMDRGAWQTTTHGLQSVGHDLATKQQEQQLHQIYYESTEKLTCTLAFNLWMS